MATYLLLFYLAFLCVFGLYSVMGIYHLLKFGYVGDLTKIVAIVYSLLSIVIIVISLILLAGKLIT